MLHIKRQAVDLQVSSVVAEFIVRKGLLELTAFNPSKVGQNINAFVLQTIERFLWFPCIGSHAAFARVVKAVGCVGLEALVLHYFVAVIGCQVRLAQLVSLRLLDALERDVALVSLVLTRSCFGFEFDVDSLLGVRRLAHWHL